MLIKDRHQLCEFCDQAWLKGLFREAYLDCLNAIQTFGKPYFKMHTHFSDWAKAAGGDCVLDICSGGGEQIAVILQHAEEQGLKLPKFIASDLYPDIEAYQALRDRFGKPSIDFIKEPVSATQALEINADHNVKLVSICTAFHHFPPDVAKSIIANAFEFGNGIFILEISKRKTFLPYIGMLFALPCLLFTPFVSRRFSWKKLFITSIIPIAPFMVWFDGFVSHFRSYTKEELISFLPKDNDIVFSYGEYWYFGLSKASYFYAYKKEHSAADLETLK